VASYRESETKTPLGAKIIMQIEKRRRKDLARIWRFLFTVFFPNERKSYGCGLEHHSAHFLRPVLYVIEE